MRKTRKKLVGKVEDQERREREQEYYWLTIRLKAEWQMLADGLLGAEQSDCIDPLSGIVDATTTRQRSTGA